MIDLVYESVWRSPDQPSLLLVHGMFAGRGMWDLNRAALFEDFNLVLVDLPGHGASPPLRDDAQSTPAALIASLESIRIELGLEKWFICGQSFGGGVTLNYALMHPQRIVAQAFTNSRTVFRNAYSPEEIEIRRERVERIRSGGRAAMRKEVFHPAHAKRFPADIKALLVENADRIDIETYLRLIDLISPALSLCNRDAAPKVPTLLINGRHERGFQSYRDALELAWPEMQIVDAEGGHAVNIEDAEGFNRTLRTFFIRKLVGA